MLHYENIVHRIVSSALKKAVARDMKKELHQYKKDLKDLEKRFKEKLRQHERLLKKAVNTKLPDGDIDIFYDDCETYEEFLEQTKNEFIRKNDARVIKDAENRDPKLCAKIKSYMNEKMAGHEITDDTFEAILKDIRRSVMVRSLFRKDPVRQSIHEKTQVEWLKRKLSPDVQKLNGAKGGLYFNEHRMTVVHPRPPSATKTLDVYSADMNMYGVLKFSTTAGGAQDNQYNDVKMFIHQMIGYMNSYDYSSEKFMFFLDGPYYTEVKLRELKNMIPDDKIDTIVITSVSRL
jgi:hypothetical protein